LVFELWTLDLSSRSKRVFHVKHAPEEGTQIEGFKLFKRPFESISAALSSTPNAERQAPAQEGAR